MSTQLGFFRAAEQRKRCGDCGEVKVVSEFRRRSARGGYRSYCKLCDSKQTRDWSRTNVAAVRENRLRKYGLTLAEFEAMNEAQKGVCRICAGLNIGDLPLFVDHDHKTGEVRGLLCNSCNAAIGYLKDDPDLMLSAAAYILGLLGHAECEI